MRPRPAPARRCATQSLARFTAVVSISGFLVLGAGCASGGPPPTDPPTTLADAAGPSGSVPLLEMEITNRAFVEWYLSRIAEATEDLIAGDPSAEVRREAATLRFMQGSSAYAIAAGPNPYAQLIDLVALITLSHVQWNEEGLAREIFTDQAAVLESAIDEAYARVWTRAERYMTPEEIAHLNDVIRAWRVANPDLRSLSFVRMTEFARELAVAMDTFREDRGLFGRIAETNREIDEARLLGERALFLMERSPLLLGWRVDAIVSDLMTHPDLADAWGDIEEISDAASGLDQRLARLESLFATLPTDFVMALSEETHLEEALRTIVRVAPAFEELPASASGVEASLARMVALVDSLESTYTPASMRSQADLASARVVSEARSLILLATGCGAGLILLYFGLGMVVRRRETGRG